MDKEKFEATVNYFKENNITLPTDVYNSIEDVFLENDTVESVQVFSKDEVEDFESYLRIENSVKISLTGKNQGSIINTYTYYGSVDYSFSEKIELYETDAFEKVYETITDIKNDQLSLIYSDTEYTVVLLEHLEWESPNNVNRKEELVIYCPEKLLDE